MVEPMKQTDPQMKIRLSPELKKSIDKSAKENMRTLNAEIVARLQASYDLDNQETESTEEIARRVAREEIAKAIKK